jgi:predicted HD phosphohydrolase
MRTDPDPATTAAVAQEVLTLLRERGHNAYLGEAVTQLEHALQAAALAEADRAGDVEVVGAMLHDVGHLLPVGACGPHEESGAAWLEERFVREVAAAARLHVEAKRYLCAVDPRYFAGLSPASVTSLAGQGGPHTPAEARAFEQVPGWEAAVRIRRWDDAAKVAGLAVPPPEHFLPYLVRAAR